MSASASSDLSARLISSPSHSMSALPLPELDLQTAPILAWRAAMEGLPSLELPGLVVSSPTIAYFQDEPVAGHVARHIQSAVSDILPPQDGFVLQGDVELFNTGLVGQLEKWMGPPPEDVVVGLEPPSIEKITIAGDFHMSMLLPLLKGTPFDDITFRNVTLYHQNYAFDKTQAVGWHFSADWVIDPSCGLLYNVLSQVLQVDRPELSLHASFGELEGWNAPLHLHSFTLEGVFSNLTLSPVSGLHLTSIGVRLMGIRGFEFAPEPHSTLSYDFSVFGTMKLDVPGSLLPLDLTYEMGINGSAVNLSAEISGQIWENALGVQDLVVRLVPTSRFMEIADHRSFYPAKRCFIHDIVFCIVTSAIIFL